MSRILLVEDEQLNREMLRIYLCKLGYTVATALDGREGLRLAEELLPDLILLDMGLPVLDGWAMTLALRANPQLAQIKVIALTAYATEGDRERCIAVGCDDYCAKPIDLAVLRERIEALLRR
jgi:CheY-like chemotaxis protein